MREVTKLELVEIILRDLSANACLLRDIPNAVYAMTTPVIEPETGRLVVFFDVALADQYGNHGPTSRNVVVSLVVPVLGESPAEVVETVKFLCDHATAQLQENVKSGRFVGLWDAQEVK